MERSKKRPYDHDAFADFVSLVVPKIGLESARWKYDIRKEQRKVTIFRLKYDEDDIATITECLSLQFRTDASDSFDYSLIPTFSSGGQKKDPSYIEGLTGKSSLTSFVDIQNLLGFLEAADNVEDDSIHEDGSFEFDEPTYPIFQRKGSVDSSVHSLDDAEGADSDGSWYEPKARAKSAKKNEGDVPPLKKIKRGRPNKSETREEDEVTAPRMGRHERNRVRSKKLDKKEKKKVGRPRREIKEDQLTALSKVSQSFGIGDSPAFVKFKATKDVTKPSAKKRGRPPIKSAEEKAEQSAKKKLSEESTVEPSASTSDMSSLPVHPDCGGTIFSSQYWRKPALSRVKLNCTNKTIHVDRDAMNNLPHVSVELEDNDEQFAQSVKYGWMLLEHLLGGPEAIFRSFVYASSESTPIEKGELTAIADKLLDAVLEHMQRSFSLDRTDDLRKEIMAVFQTRMDVKYSDQKGFKKKNRAGLLPRQPSDMFLREHLEGCSYPKPGKVQVAPGFDFYIDETKLKEIEDQFRDKEEPDRRRYGRFGMHIVAEMVGGFDVYLRGAKQVPEGLRSSGLIGDDIFEAIYLRTRKTFGVEDTLTLPHFRGFIRGYLDRKKEIKVNKDTGLMASVLFQPEAALPSTSNLSRITPSASLVAIPVGPQDQSAVPGHNYWATPGTHRTRLSPNSDFYVDTTRLAEYQRYLGPECGKTTKGLNGKDWATYLKVLLQYVASGEEQYLKKLLQRRKAKQEGQTMLVLDDAVVLAIFEHVTTLFKAPKNKQNLPDCIENFSSRLLELYDKGVTRWHFPDLDERPRPEGVLILDEKEYWRKPAPDRTQLRPGHDVYIRTKMLESVASYFGPGSKENDIKKYCFGIMMHMLGGPEVSHKLWTGKYFLEGFRSMFVFDDLVAVCLHSDEVYHLMFSVSPTDSLIYAGVRMHRRDRHHNAMLVRIAKGSKLRHPRNSLHFALSEE